MNEEYFTDEDFVDEVVDEMVVDEVAAIDEPAREITYFGKFYCISEMFRCFKCYMFCRRGKRV